MGSFGYNGTLPKFYRIDFKMGENDDIFVLAVLLIIPWIFTFVKELLKYQIFIMLYVHSLFIRL